MKQLTWEEIAYCARDKFSVWAGKSQYSWAKFTWNILVREGLTNYSDEIERQKVLIRLLILATFYNEFCDLVFDIEVDRSGLVSNWLSDDEGIYIQPTRIWQLIGPNFYRNETIVEMDQDELLVEAINELIDNMLPA